KDLKEYLLDLNWKRKNLLMMSSGTFDGLDLNKLADKVTR
ncbi:MAG: UDP-N-acetylmuramate: L-alanyl-gamma-D-glutamyl-meso-diaminopimelate ligase, partial [Bacteroidia bacterium]